MGNIVEAGGFGDTRIPTDEDIPDDVMEQSNPLHNPQSNKGLSIGPNIHKSLGGRKN